EDLHGDAAAELGVLGLVHDAHRAAGHLADEAVLPDPVFRHAIRPRRGADDLAADAFDVPGEAGVGHAESPPKRASSSSWSSDSVRTVCATRPRMMSRQRLRALRR